MYPEEKRGNWWSRNWKWVVPVGCLVPILLVGGCFASIFWVATTAMKSSDVYKDALLKAQENPEVVEALGTPITAGFFTGGNINTNGPSGEAAFSIPLSGPKGKGKIHLEAEKSAGEWSYSTLEVEIENPAKRIDLLKESEPSEPADTEPSETESSEVEPSEPN